MSEMPNVPSTTDLRWHLNEALSALHEVHVDHHMDAEGNPVPCDICDIWRDGLAVLKGERDA